MTANKPSGKKNKVDWNKKNVSDSERIKQRAQKRNMTPKEDKDINMPQSLQKVPLASGEPLLRLREKIKEIYNDEKDEITTPLYFNIELIDENEQTKKEQSEKDIIRQTKEQELTAKMNIIMSSAIAANKAGLNPKMTKTDANRATSAEFNPQKLQQKTLHDKIEKPLNLDGAIKTDKLSETVEGINKLTNHFSPDSLKNLKSKDIPDLKDDLITEDIEDTAQNKHIKRSPKKSLLEIAQGLNKYKDFDNENQKND